MQRSDIFYYVVLGLALIGIYHGYYLAYLVWHAVHIPILLILIGSICILRRVEDKVVVGTARGINKTTLDTFLSYGLLMIFPTIVVLHRTESFVTLGLYAATILTVVTFSIMAKHEAKRRGLC